MKQEQGIKECSICQGFVGEVWQMDGEFGCCVDLGLNFIEKKYSCANPVKRGRDDR
jgi:hypothetical protein